MRVSNMLPPCCVYPQVDEHPTQSRFWTFREAICRLFAMHVLGFPSNALRLRSVRPRKENKTRLARVLGFFADTSSPQALRQACLCLQLTGAALSFTAQTDKDDPNVAPLSARLSQGAAHTLVRDTLSSILVRLHMDPVLDVGAVCGSLFCTACDLLLRSDLRRLTL